ncbi:hypothetical protein RUND412_001490 [Rhizina undulata]
MPNYSRDVNDPDYKAVVDCIQVKMGQCPRGDKCEWRHPKHVDPSVSAYCRHFDESAGAFCPRGTAASKHAANTWRVNALKPTINVTITMRGRSADLTSRFWVMSTSIIVCRIRTHYLSIIMMAMKARMDIVRIIKARMDINGLMKALLDVSCLKTLVEVTCMKTLVNINNMKTLVDINNMKTLVDINNMKALMDTNNMKDPVEINIVVNVPSITRLVTTEHGRYVQSDDDYHRSHGNREDYREYREHSYSHRKERSAAYHYRGDGSHHGYERPQDSMYWETIRGGRSVRYRNGDQQMDRPQGRYTNRPHSDQVLDKMPTTNGDVRVRTPYKADNDTEVPKQLPSSNEGRTDKENTSPEHVVEKPIDQTAEAKPKSKEKSLPPPPSYYDQLHPKQPTPFRWINADWYPVDDEYEARNAELIADRPLFPKKNKHLKDDAKEHIRPAEVLESHVVQQENHLGNETQDHVSAGKDTVSRQVENHLENNAQEQVSAGKNPNGAATNPQDNHSETITTENDSALVHVKKGNVVSTREYHYDMDTGEITVIGGDPEDDPIVHHEDNDFEEGPHDMDTGEMIVIGGDSENANVHQEENGFEAEPWDLNSSDVNSNGVEGLLSGAGSGTVTDPNSSPLSQAARIGPVRPVSLSVPLARVVRSPDLDVHPGPDLPSRAAALDLPGPNIPLINEVAPPGLRIHTVLGGLQDMSTPLINEVAHLGPRGSKTLAALVVHPDWSIRLARFVMATDLNVLSNPDPSSQTAAVIRPGPKTLSIEQVVPPGPISQMTPDDPNIPSIEETVIESGRSLSPGQDSDRSKRSSRSERSYKSDRSVRSELSAGYERSRGTVSPDRASEGSSSRTWNSDEFPRASPVFTLVDNPSPFSPGRVPEGPIHQDRSPYGSITPGPKDTTELNDRPTSPFLGPVDRLPSGNLLDKVERPAVTTEEKAENKESKANNQVVDTKQHPVEQPPARVRPPRVIEAWEIDVVDYEVDTDYEA